MSQRVIHIHPLAAPKPSLGAACNGCGVCCLLEPCPVGILVSRRRSGACAALQWQPEDSTYRCGVLANPQRYTRLDSSLLNKLVVRIVRRFISAGSGCDCDAQTEVGRYG